MPFDTSRSPLALPVWSAHDQPSIPGRPGHAPADDRHDERNRQARPVVPESDQPADVGPKRVAVGRRVFLGMAALGAAGIALGAKAQSLVGDALGSGLGGLLPGGDRFRIYSVSGTFPAIPPDRYRLKVDGLVERPTTFSLDDLKSMPARHS